MSGADDQSSTPPESRMDFDFGLWQSFYANEEPDAGLLFVSSNLDRAPNSYHIPKETHMTVSGQSTATCAMEPLPDSTHPVQWQPENMTTMNNSQQLQGQMMLGLHKDQNVRHDDFGETALPEITITDNDIHQETGDIWPWQTSFDQPFLEPGWFSGSATPSSASSFGSGSSDADLNVLAAPLGSESEGTQFSPASNCEDHREGPYVVTEASQPRRTTKRPGLEPPEQAGNSALQSTPKRHRWSSKRKARQRKPHKSAPASDREGTSLYRTITHSQHAKANGQPHMAKLYVYNTQVGGLEPNLDGFAALLRLHRKSIQSWATKHIVVELDSRPSQDDGHKTNKQLQSQRQHRTREVREYFCGHTLWPWYKSVLQSLSMDQNTATRLSQMTINQINRSPDIAQLISWESIRAALTTTGQNNPIQTIKSSQIGKNVSAEWEAIMVYGPMPKVPSAQASED